MAEYLNDKIGHLELNNQSGISCALECYYKSDVNDTPKRVGQSSFFPIGQSKSLKLDDLNIPNGVYVTAFVNVKSGKDSSGSVWLKYEKESNKTAKFKIAGVINFTTVSFVGIDGDIDLNKKVGLLKLNNQSGTVCALECYYKVNKDDTPKRVGQTDFFPLGQNSSLNLDSLNIPDGAYITAFANVQAGKDTAGEAWLIYQKNNKRTAKFQISGAINYTVISLTGILEYIGTLTGYAIPMNTPDQLDHTYVYSQTDGDNEVIHYPCWGRDAGGKEICKAKGNVGIANDIAGSTGTAGIVYGINGLCHQTANRILYPAQVLVNKAKGYAASSLFYGDYGSGFNPPALLFDNEQNYNSYFGKVNQVMQKYDVKESSQENLLEQRFESFSALISNQLGDSYTISDVKVKSILAFTITEKSALDKQLDDKSLDIMSYAVKINALANSVLSQFAKILSDSDYLSLFDFEKEITVELVDLNRLRD